MPGKKGLGADPGLPPDDDPQFARWVRLIGAQQMPPSESPEDRHLRPVIAGLVVSAAIAGLMITIGVAAALALDLVTPVPAAVIMLGGICCALTGFCLVYLVIRA